MPHIKFTRTGRALLLAAALFALLHPLSARSSELKPDAQEPFNRGLAAAQAGQFPLAVEYFAKAFEADNEAPEIWFNLGLAHSKIPGHEFRAMAALKAYLIKKYAFSPEAPHRKAMEDLKSQLSLRIEGLLHSLLNELRKTLPRESVRRCFLLDDLAELEELAGFRNRSLTTLNEIEMTSLCESQLDRAKKRVAAVVSWRESNTSNLMITAFAGFRLTSNQRTESYCEDTELDKCLQDFRRNSSLSGEALWREMRSFTADLAHQLNRLR